MNSWVSNSSAKYEVDRYQWLMEQASMLKKEKLESIDTANLAIEIEDLARNAQFSAGTQVQSLLIVAFVCKALPDNMDKSEWLVELELRREALNRLYMESPSLKVGLEELVDRRWQSAIHSAAVMLRNLGCKKFVLPQNSSISLDDVFGYK